MHGLFSLSKVTPQCAASAAKAPPGGPSALCPPHSIMGRRAGWEGTSWQPLGPLPSLQHYGKKVGRHLPALKGPPCSSVQHARNPGGWARTLTAGSAPSSRRPRQPAPWPPWPSVLLSMTWVCQRRTPSWDHQFRPDKTSVDEGQCVEAGGPGAVGVWSP